MFDIRKLFGGKSEPHRNSDEQAPKSELMTRCERFTSEALRARTTATVPFLELPVYLTVLFQAKGRPPMPDAVRHVMEAEEKLAFKCVECGELNSALVLRTYQPLRVTKENALCPNCHGSDKVEMTYDPNGPTKFEQLVKQANIPLY